MLKSSLSLLVNRWPTLSRALGASNGLRIVYYHSVVGQGLPYYDSDDIDFDQFKRQIDHLEKRFTFIPLNDALDRQKKGQDLSGYVCIGFDDGFEDCYSRVFPYLESKGIKATFFLIEDCIDNHKMMWRNRLLFIQTQLGQRGLVDFMRSMGISAFDDLLSWSDTWKMSDKEGFTEALWHQAQMPPLTDVLQTYRPYLSSDQIKEMIDHGHEIGLHTKSHPYCNKLDDGQVIEEIIEPYARLSFRFDTRIRAMSYPFGERCNPKQEKKMAELTGIECFLGIRDSLSNQSPITWERQGMEMSFEKSMAGFYFMPWKRRVTSQEQNIDLRD